MTLSSVAIKNLLMIFFGCCIVAIMILPAPTCSIFAGTCLYNSHILNMNNFTQVEQPDFNWFVFFARSWWKEKAINCVKSSIVARFVPLLNRRKEIRPTKTESQPIWIYAIRVIVAHCCTLSVNLERGLLASSVICLTFNSPKCITVK